jgi:hypothetical protein
MDHKKRHHSSPHFSDSFCLFNCFLLNCFIIIQPICFFFFFLVMSFDGYCCVDNKYMVLFYVFFADN